MRTVDEEETRGKVITECIMMKDRNIMYLRHKSIKKRKLYWTMCYLLNKLLCIAYIFYYKLYFIPVNIRIKYSKKKKLHIKNCPS